MRVFVTGASGGIGSAVVPELVAHGHEVLGLARSDASAKIITERGATPLRGDLADPASLRAGVAETDGVIHLAFDNDFSNVERSIAAETAAIDTYAAAMEDTGKALVIASGSPATPGRVSTEDDRMPTDGPMGGRGRNARTVLELAAKGVRSATVGLPRSVHQAGQRYGFASMLIAAARQSGVSGYVGDGSQRWPAVHCLDAATLFRLVLEKAEPGTVAHAVADEGDSMLSIATAIGHELALPVEPVSTESFGFLGSIFAMDQPSSSAKTRELFGWQPKHPSLLDDLRAGDYPS
ncbi:SDR family oxidoreductase [Microlunatus soli]|uniref:Nucleoside-diphosphate-sugar epimerase n=1 Tax=Microlunatus soli TaxID=630515 RepID=A0A1H1XAW2_9ACTN|nr:SDR family oxidoreductase [Microlunatus soli]SDT06483.1 Nucleoside-diphosphate-sugar epimerase [Microlunatus soli]